MKRLAILAAFALVTGVGTAMAVGIAQLPLLHLAATVTAHEPIVTVFPQSKPEYASYAAWRAEFDSPPARPGDANPADELARQVGEFMIENGLSINDVREALDRHFGSQK
jgi:hypothetical protein